MSIVTYAKDLGIPATVVAAAIDGLSHLVGSPMEAAVTEVLGSRPVLSAHIAVKYVAGEYGHAMLTDFVLPASIKHDVKKILNKKKQIEMGQADVLDAIAPSLTANEKAIVLDKVAAVNPTKIKYTVPGLGATGPKGPGMDLS